MSASLSSKPHEELRASSARSRHDEVQCTTQRYDRLRTGWNPRERRLDVAGVASGLKRLATFAVLGEVFAQPLYVSGVEINGRHHDLLFLVTSENWIYAFDAQTLTPVWPPRTLTPPGSQPYLSNMAYAGLSYNDFSPGRKVGIIGTPVIDTDRHVAWLVAVSQTSPYVPGGGAPAGTVHHWLHAIDLKTGRDHAASPPVQISATLGSVSFDSRVQMQRPGLLLSHDRLFIGFGSYGDNNHVAVYGGWVLVYDARHLTQQAAFLASQQGGGSVWQSGTGIAGDEDGSAYFATGNGPFGPLTPLGTHGRTDYGDSIVRLAPSAPFAAVDSFTPFNQDTLNSSDLDLGSGGVLLVPGEFGGPKFAIQVGKFGTAYVLDRSHLGGFEGPVGPDDVVSSTPLPGAGGETFYGCPTYYRASNGDHLVYFGAMGQPVSCYKLDGGGGLTQVWQSVDHFPGYGTIPVVSSHESRPGSAVLWSIQNTMDGGNTLRLKAYAAEGLGGAIADLNCGSWPKQGSFLVPTVADGRVYVASDGEVQVFGL